MNNKDMDLRQFDGDNEVEDIFEERIRQSYRQYMGEQKAPTALKEKTLQAMLEFEENQTELPHEEKPKLHVYPAKKRSSRRLIYSAAGLILIVVLLILWRNMSPYLSRSKQMDSMQAPEKNMMSTEAKSRKLSETRAAQEEVDEKVEEKVKVESTEAETFEAKVANKDAGEAKLAENERVDYAAVDAVDAVEENAQEEAAMEDAAEEVEKAAAAPAEEMKKAEMIPDQPTENRRQNLFWTLLESLNTLPKNEKEYKITFEQNLKLEAEEEELIRRFASDVVAAWLGKTAGEARESAEAKLELVINNVIIEEGAWSEFSLSVKGIAGVKESKFKFRWDAQDQRWKEE